MVMAKSNPTSPARSKVKILFVDAELASGDLEKLTNALASAMRPTHLVPKAPPRLSAGAAASDGDADGSVDDGEEVTIEETDEVPNDEADAPKTPRKRNYRSPKVVEMDMNAGGKAFKDFATEKTPDNHTDRYLVAAYWLSEYANISPCTADHVYTCYKSADWMFDVSDPNFPFRELSKKRRGEGITKGGNFTINHIGKANVKKMSRAEGTS
jgi:hypothetical protein